MATLQELYNHKRFCEEQGYEIPPKLLQDIEQMELDALWNLPDWAINSLPVRTEVDDYTGPFTILIEYRNNEMVGAGVRKDFPAYENSNFYVDARKVYGELFEDTKNDDFVEEPDQNPRKYGHRSKSIGFTVHFNDGKVIDGSNASQVMIDSLRYMGLERASKWKDITFKGFPLIGKTKRNIPEGRGSRQKLIDGWWIYVNMPNTRKIACLKGVANMLGIGIEIKPKTDNSLFENIEETQTIEEQEKSSRQRYILNGSMPLYKNRVIYQAIKQMLSDIPNTTYKDLEDIFPHALQGGYGVFETLEQIGQREKMGQTVQKRYFLDPSDVLTSSDGIKFAVCTQWDYRNFPRVQSIITDFLGYTLEEYK